MCGKKFFEKKAVFMHKLSKHGVLPDECDLPVYDCPHCDKRFLRRDFHEKHVRTHGAAYSAADKLKKSHLCDECPHTAATIRALRRHRVEVHEKGGVGGKV
jgi:hypothetical protein